MAADHRIWAEVQGDIRVTQRELVEQMHRERPGVVAARMSMVEAHGLVWLCLEGWLAQPSDWGPEPTAADVPVGFA